MNRPQNKARRTKFLCIIGCEGKNQERMYFDRVAELVNHIEKRTHDLIFDYAEPYGGNPKCVVQRTVQKSIGKENKASVFDYDGKKIKYEEAIDLAKEHKIELGYLNYCFDLWLIIHKEEYMDIVEHQDHRQTYGLDSNANIKKEKRVEEMMEQITLPDIKNAIIRAEKIAANNQNRSANTTPQGNKYYDNPDTQMHTLLQFLFGKVGIRLDELDCLCH